MEFESSCTDPCALPVASKTWRSTWCTVFRALARAACIEEVASKTECVALLMSSARASTSNAVWICWQSSLLANVEYSLVIWSHPVSNCVAVDVKWVCNVVNWVDKVCRALVTFPPSLSTKENVSLKSCTTCVTPGQNQVESLISSSGAHTQKILYVTPNNYLTYCVVYIFHPR